MSDETRTLESSTLAGSGGAQADLKLPGLTIAYHADPQRIGERTRLKDLFLTGRAELSRKAPVFETADGVPTDALQDPYVSRKPVVITAKGDRVRIDPTETSTEVRVDGERLEQARVLTSEALERGVVLQLADRVLLVLHLLAPPRERPPRFGLVGESDAMDQVRAEIARVATEDVPVLLRGESGTGKELLAKAIHSESQRRRGPFVSVNMAAIPETTAAAELFGHSRGAFTGATGEHRGFFGQADGGTLFLDEIGETPSSVQPILLRVLETGEIQSVGGRHKDRVNVRLVAATDADLERAVEEGVFRVSLLHRLAGYEVMVPALRERLDDVGRLLYHFLRQELEPRGEADLLSDRGAKRKPWLPIDLMSRLLRYDWPGNVRQLKNVAQQLVIASLGHERARVNRSVERLLPAATAAAPSTSSASSRSAGPAVTRSSRTNLDEISDEVLIAALKKHAWRVAASARELGISKNSLYQLMDRCPEIRPAKELTKPEILEMSDKLQGDVTLMAEELMVSRRGLQLRMRELGLGAKR